ncbi:hypothetical protein ACHQM5_014961 [Ranunculus cassubicifolius]
MGSELEPQENDKPNEEIKPWSDLPFELLGQIGDKLPLVELLGFRSTCKDWRSASSTALAECESSVDKEPWFLLYNNGDLDSNSNCRLYQPSTNKIYSIEIPELNGSTCIASKQGWLLLLRETSVFFFCPFSRAKIDLPDLPYPNLVNPVGVFSTLPTSLDCIVCVMHDLNENSKDVNTLKRGASEWGKHTLERYGKTITGAAFSNEAFYFSDADKHVLTYYLETEKWVSYTVVPSGKGDTSSPFLFTKNYFESDLKQKLGLREEESLSICGTVLQRHDWGDFIHNEDIKAGEAEKLHQNKGVWIHPRFFQVPANQSWAL